MFMKTCALILFAVLAGCAQPVPVKEPPKQLLTDEQQKYVMERCSSGCAIIPGPVWQKILERLQGEGA